MIFLGQSGPSDAVQDYGTIAGLYSQLAGVLAGFAFVGIIALITTPPKSASGKFVVFSFAPLIASFIGLIATSLDYAIVAGEGEHNARGASLETVAGVGFCVAGNMLFYSILVLLRATTPNRGSKKVLRITTSVIRSSIVFGISPLVIFLLYGGAADQEVHRYGRAAGFHTVDFVAYALVVVTFAVGAIATWRARKATIRRKIRQKMILALSISTIATSMVCVAGTSATMIFTGEDSLEPEYVTLVQFGVLAIVTWGISLSSANLRV
jgi:hypothetical protein